MSCFPPFLPSQPFPPRNANPFQDSTGYRRAVVIDPDLSFLPPVWSQPTSVTAAYRAQISTISAHAGGSHPPPLSPSTHDPRVRLCSPSRQPGADNQAFIDQAAPPQLRGALRAAIESDWWRMNTPEKHQDLDQFLVQPRPDQWRCMLRGCPDEVTWNRKERAVDHVRKHLDHRPFQCVNDRCGNTDCTLAFLSKRDLQSHLKPVSVDCDRCGQTVRKRNLPRHQESTTCRRISGISGSQRQASTQ